jgi:hypothetical protein
VAEGKKVIAATWFVWTTDFIHSQNVDKSLKIGLFAGFASSFTQGWPPQYLSEG